MKKSNLNRLKISNVDLQTFLVESMEIDPYWEDLYNPKPKPKKKLKYERCKKE
jgi:hypothetical protein